MAIGGLVAVPELQAEGPARLLKQTAGYLEIEFLATGASMTVEAKQVVRYGLVPGTRIKVQHLEAELEAQVLTQPPETDRDTGCIRYTVQLDNGDQAGVMESDILSLAQVHNPGEQLVSVGFHEIQARFAKAGTALPPEPWGPLTFCARERVLDWRDAGWAETGGVIGLAAARVVPLPHQILAARRILADRQIRFLLADEVGLGKTIEAGLVTQSLLAMNPKHRVLVVVPGALSSQWFLELYVKFGGRRFTMLDGERLADIEGDPWKEQFIIVSSRAIEELTGRDAIRFAQAKWDIVIVDECHRMRPGGLLYRRIASLSKKTSNVLLLSATPPRQHADAYLALLHLLQPAAYDLEAVEEFASKRQAMSALASLIADLRQQEGVPDGLVEAWEPWTAEDHELARAFQAYVQHPDAEHRESLVSYVREHYLLDHRVIRNRRQVLSRLSAETGTAGLALGKRALTWVDYKSDEAERAVRDALMLYRDTLLQHFAEDGEIPPRLAHWLLQLELGMTTHARVLERLLAMRDAVVGDPEEFADYRDRAQDGEDLADVLRGDCSEAESATQIAISASCHVDVDSEAPVLQELRSSVGKWVKRVPRRCRLLLDKLGEFWDEFPLEKVLVFTGHGIAVKEVAEYLSGRLPEIDVATFGAHQEPLEREKVAARFRDDDRCCLLISDALGGEGRNFQFVSLVVHLDLPWSVAAVEQRIGRVDRLGRDGEVPSWVVRCSDEDAIDSAWSRVLDQAVGVFTASSSGLEFIAAEVETRALHAALHGGGAGLDAVNQDLVDLVAGERDERDEAEDELYQDGLQAFRSAAALAERIADTRPPVSELCRWLRGMGGSVRRDEEPPKAFSLRASSSTEPVEGVFNRGMALQYENQAFFGRGHDLIDRLVDDAAAADWCAATAWRRRPSAQCRKWEGLRVTYELQLDFAPLLQAGLSLDALRRLFAISPPCRLRRFIRIDGSIEDNAGAIAALSPGFDHKAGDSTLSQRTSREAWMRPVLGGKVEQVVTWQNKLRRCYSVAEEQAPTLLEEERQRADAILRPHLQAAVDLAKAQAATTARRLGTAHPDAERLQEEAFAESEQCRCLQAALDGASMHIASVAYQVIA